MRVVLPAWRLLSPRGGVGKNLWYLLREFALQAPDDEFIVLHDGPQADLPQAPNLSAAQLRAPLLENNFTWNECALPWALRRYRPDLVHNISYTLPCAVRGPSVVTVHDVSYARHPEWFPAKAGAYLRWGTAQAARRARLIITDSEFSAGEIAQVYHVPRERIEVVPLATDAIFAPRSDLTGVRRRYGLPARYVLYVGGIHTRRRLPLLLRACAQVLPTRDAHLVVVGPSSGDGFDTRAEADRLGLAERVTLLGFVPEEDLPGLYGAAAAFAWPAVYEGFGLPPLEALACGTPTVVANAGSLPEVVGDAALLAEPDNADALADALARLLDDRDLAARLAAAGPERAARYSWAETARRTLAVYRRCLAAGV